MTSTRSPERANAGSVAVTITAATLRLESCCGVTFSPNSRSALATDCRVAWLRVESPVPARPLTMP